MDQDQILSVTELNSNIKKIFNKEKSLNSVRIKGELSNFKKYKYGYYFSLKDEKSKISAMMFGSYANTLKFTPKDGMNVIVKGKVDVYEIHGNYNFYVHRMIDDGLGDLHIAFNKLKEKLKTEGLFDRERTVIPKFPKKIAILTSQSGAVISDITETIKKRWKLADIVLIPTLVQGDNAKNSIIKSIKIANDNDFDLIILGRGGGSIEDLWAFNEEIVVRAVANSKIPIITAVGHETDVSISDLVSDHSSLTPTAAAEFSVPNISEIENRINNNKKLLNKYFLTKINDLESQYENSKNSYILKNFSQEIDSYDELLKSLKMDLSKNYEKTFNILENSILNIKNNYILNNPDTLIKPNSKNLDVLKEKLVNNFNKDLDSIDLSFNNLKSSFVFKNPNFLYETKMEALPYIQRRMDRAISSQFLSQENTLKNISEKIANNYNNDLEYLENLLDNVKNSYIFKNPNMIYEPKMEVFPFIKNRMDIAFTDKLKFYTNNLKNISEKLPNSFKNNINSLEISLNNIKSSYVFKNPNIIYETQMEAILPINNRLNNAILADLNNKENHLKILNEKLAPLDPEKREVIVVESKINKISLIVIAILIIVIIVLILMFNN